MLRSALALGLYMDGNGVCWPSVATLAASVGRSERAIQQGIRALVLHGYLAVEYHRRRANVYRWRVEDDYQLLPGSLVVPGISTGALRCALVLARQMGPDGICWPRIARLAELLGASASTAKRHVAELVGAGAIHRVHCYVDGRGGRRSNTYVWPHRVDQLAGRVASGGIRRHQERVRAEAVIASLRPEALSSDSASYAGKAMRSDSAPRTSNTKNRIPVLLTRDEEAGQRAGSALGRDGTTTTHTHPRRRAMTMRRNPPPVENPPRPRRDTPNPWRQLERLQERIEAEGGPWSELALDVIDRVPDAEVNGLAGELLMVLDGATWPGRAPTVAQVAQALHEWQVLGGGGGCRHIRGCLRKVIEGDPVPAAKPRTRGVDQRGKPLSPVQVYVRDARAHGVDLLAMLAGRPQPTTGSTTHEVIDD